jgi:hypothetical protein
MNTITRNTAKEMGFDFNSLLKDMTTSKREHRRGSTFYLRSIVEINEECFPKIPRELDGYWETNQYNWSEVDWDIDDIAELFRVEKKERVITEIYWEKVKD